MSYVLNAVAGHGEAGVIEDIEELRVISQRETFSQLESFEESHVKPVLEGRAEYVAPASRVGSFEVVTGSRGGIARGHAISQVAWRERRGWTKCIYIQH